MLNLNQEGYAPVIDESDRINALIDKALEMEESFSTKRDYLGGSKLGVECLRALQYDFTHTPIDQDKLTPARMLRIFARGHWIESAMGGWIQKSALGITLESRDGGQYGFDSHGGYVKGHYDGIVIAGPDNIGPFPRMWECKGLGAKYWRAVKKHGLQKERPVYYAQVQYYMHKSGVNKNPAMWGACNMDTMDLYWERVPYNRDFAMRLDAKASQILEATQAGQWLPRTSEQREFFKCRFCDWQATCHGEAR